MGDLNRSELYTNRELSWLQFNSRVLQQSQKESYMLQILMSFI